MDLWRELRNPNCQECELHKTAITTCLMGRGSVPADIMLVGEAPGQHEKTAPFQGKAGKMILDPLLNKFNLRRSDIYISNICKCHPKNNATPKISEMRACRHYLLDEIKYVKPKKIIAMGTTAVKGICDDNRLSLKKTRGGRISFPEFPDIGVYPSYHPAAVLYDRYVEKLLYEDFEFALKGRGEVKDDRHYWLVNDTEEAWDICLDLARGKMAFDFETTGLDTLYPTFDLLTVGLCGTAGEAYCIPLNHPESKIPEEEWRAMLSLLVNSTQTLIAHNVKYELKCLSSKSIGWPEKIRDTLVDFYLLDEAYPSKSLYTLKRRYFPHLSRAEERVINTKVIGSLKKQPLRKVAAYNCEDADATFRLAKKFQPKIKTQDMIPLQNFLMEAVETLTEAELNGMEIDETVLEHNKIMFEGRLDEIERKYPQVNLNSPKQVADLLFKKYRLPVLETTDDGHGKTTSDILESLIGDYRSRRHRTLLRDLLIYRKVKHFYTHFLEGTETFIKSDGRIHVSYNLVKHERGGKDVGTVTGRLSASLIHQIPRDTSELEEIFGEDTIQIKEMFISRFRGGLITQGDYSQIELREMAEYSRDENMIEDFKSGVDIHTAVTQRLIPIAPKYYDHFKKFEEKRKATKAVNFGIIYGISPMALSERLETSLDDASKIISAWFKAYRGVHRWIARTERRIVIDKEVVSLIGRRRRLPAAEFRSAKGREAIRQGVNALIQGLASDLQLMGMIATRKEFKRRKMHSLIIGTVHDSVLVDTHPDEKDLVAKILKRCYENPDLSAFGVNLVVPLVLDIEQARSWSKRRD